MSTDHDKINLDESIRVTRIVVTAKALKCHFVKAITWPDFITVCMFGQSA